MIWVALYGGPADFIPDISGRVRIPRHQMPQPKHRQHDAALQGQNVHAGADVKAEKYEVMTHIDG